MRYILAFFGFLFSGCATAQTGNVPKSIYDFKVEGLDGGTIDFSQFKGKRILIVNTASKCGFTKQYEGLEALYKEHSDKVVVIGFPANNFMSQEPGSNEEIAGFCQKNYGVTFPMAAKISVKGKEMAPIYRWLTNKDLNGLENSSVKWNFHKYVVDEQGKLVASFPSSTKPDAPELLKALGL